VGRVKSWQRMSDAHQNAWYIFCRKMGSEGYDPSRHDAMVLQTFLSKTESGEIQPVEPEAPLRRRAGGNPPAGSGGLMQSIQPIQMFQPEGGWGSGRWSPWTEQVMMEMINMWMGKGGGKGKGKGKAAVDPNDPMAQKVAQVKEWQRLSAAHKGLWHDFCIQNGSTDFDPARHDESTLQTFLNKTASGEIVVLPEAMGTTGDGGTNKAALVARVKAWQRMSFGHKTAWHSFCTQNGSKNFDPAHYEEYVLESFLSKTASGEIQAEAGACGSARVFPY